MNTKFYIPIKLLEKIDEAIDIDWRFADLKERQRQKLVKRLVELWYFIYQSQINDDDLPNLQFYVDIHTDDLRRFDIMIAGLRLRYRDLIKIIPNLIGCNGSYLNGKYSLGYRVNTRFLQFTNLVEYNIDFDLVLKRTKNKEYWLNKYPEQSNLIEDAYNTKINLDEYLSWLQQNIGTELNPVYDKTSGKIKRRFLTPERLYAHFNMALKVNLQNLWFKLSNEGRFYSSISNLPSKSIDFLSLHGGKTKRCDIKNCQPLLLATLIDNKQFKQDCQSGIFYDKIRTTLLESVSDLKRSQIKIMIYRYIFFASKQLKSGVLYDTMVNLYGDAISQINHLKSNINLAHQLQKMESDIFVKKIGKIKLPKLIRHDEVIVLENDGEKIQNYLIKEFNNLGIKVEFAE